MGNSKYDLRKFDIWRPNHPLFVEDPALDFAGWDDFFERDQEHDGLDAILQEGYSVIIFFTGNRWYASILPLNATTTFKDDSHAFVSHDCCSTRFASYLQGNLTSYTLSLYYHTVGYIAL
jgi:hypothetical protein